MEFGVVRYEVEYLTEIRSELWDECNGLEIVEGMQEVEDLSNHLEREF